MTYVDGFVMPIKKGKLKEYKKMAQDASKIWMKHGALQYVECVGDDLDPQMDENMKVLPFPTMAKTKKDETVVFAFIVYKSRAHRDRVNAKVMKEMDEKYADMKDMPMPFEPERMAYGGFKTIVEA